MDARHDLTDETRELEDGELLRSMLAGDEEALIVLYQRRQSNLSLRISNVGSVTLAEDVTQKCFFSDARRTYV